MVGHIVPDLRTVILLWLPVLVAEEEQIGGLDDIIVTHRAAQVSIHGIEGYISIPRVDLGMELHVPCSC